MALQFANISSANNSKWSDALSVVAEVENTAANARGKAERARRMGVVRDRRVEFCDALTAALLPESGEPAVAKDVSNVNGGDSSRVIVLQGEVGWISSSSLPPEDGKPQITDIASVDATSCAIVAVRASRPNDQKDAAVALAHFDIAGMALPRTVMQMATDYTADQLKPSADSGAIEYTWYLAGAVVDMKYTVDMLPMIFGAIASVMQKFPERSHRFASEGSCFWSGNLVGRPGPSASIRVRGLSIDLLSGTAKAIEIVPGTRKYPFANLRGLRFVSESDPRKQEALPCVTALASEEGGGACRLRIVVSPFRWRPFQRELIRATAEELASWSTTPSLEPVDFGQNLKAAVVFSIVHSPEEVFKAADGGVPTDRIAKLTRSAETNAGQNPFTWAEE